MRVIIEIDQELLRKAQELSGIQSVESLLHRALLEFIGSRERPDLRELRGAGLLDENYDHKELRGG